MADKLPLTVLPRALGEAGYQIPKYRTVYNASVDGRAPIERQDNGRWMFDPDQIPAIADALGLPLLGHPIAA